MFSFVLIFSLMAMVLHVSLVASEEKVAKFPLQLSFNLKITAHQIDADNEFPPRVRKMEIHYDYINSRARANMEPGFEAEKTYIRRYDNKNEYMVRMPPLNDCKRSYLGETMPYPLIPETEFIKDNEIINGKRVDYYLHSDYETRIHMYFEHGTYIPVQLLQESVSGSDESNGSDGISTPMLTYDFEKVIIGEPDIKLFDLMEPYTHELCERHVGGFPFLHVFHYFVKF
jgi:hypothetical protein